MTGTPAQPRTPDTGDHLKLLRFAMLIVSGLVGLSAAWGIWDSIGHEPKVWALLGFEVVVLVASVLGVFVGLGRLREAPALAGFSIAGTVFAATTLGRFSAIVTRSGGAVSEGQAFRQLLRDPVFDARLLAVAALGCVALAMAFGKDSRSWRSFLAGLASAVPVLAALVWLMGSGRAWLLAPVSGAGGIARVIGALAGGLGLVVLASMAVHLIVRAFELRLPPVAGLARRKPAPRKPAAAAPNKGA